jgi:KDO2-lipid IV(A) lauroyltransferase
MGNIAASAGAWVMETTLRIVRLIPLPIRLPLISLLGFLFGRAAKNMREPLIQNLQEILDLDRPRAETAADAVFRNFALTLHDFFNPDGLVLEVPDREKLEKVRREHGGILVLTFHLGNWELGARTMQQWGWPVTAVYQPYRNKRFKKLIEEHRAPGVNFLPVGGRAARGVREALRNGGVVAMLGDHPFGEEGEPVNLLGHRVLWPRGPVILAVRGATPIVVAAIVRVGRQRYHAIVEDPLIPKDTSLAEVDRLVQEVADKFGKVVTRHPTQWYRFRPFEIVEEKISSGV